MYLGVGNIIESPSWGWVIVVVIWWCKVGVGWWKESLVEQATLVLVAECLACGSFGDGVLH